MKHILFILICLSSSLLVAGQTTEIDSLLKGDEKPSKVSGAFKSTRVINGHSIAMLGKGVLDFRILHRFGEIDEGFKQLFGLDEASMRMGFDYGLSDNVTIGIGRSTYNKELDGFLKWRLLSQQTGAGSPLTLVAIAGAAVNATSNSLLPQKMSGKERTSYYYQLLAGRKFSEKFSLQLAPTVVHRNVVSALDDNDIYALGIGSRYKLSKRVAFVVDYFYVFNGLPESEFKNPLSVGIDIETGGHVFQLHFTNAVGMNERAFITETSGNWGDGDLRFGFNLSRVFTLSKR